jgi:LacI family gluconate utilization system Gnt-I transcriptional repressor
VVAGLLGADAEAAKLRALGIAIVETWDFSEQPIDMLVGFSHPAVGQAVAHFCRLKQWKRVGVASADDQRALQRLAGFKSAIGRPIAEALVAAPSTLASGRQALADLLAQDSLLQAVACSSDALAAGVATEARARGLRVPQDLAICGFGDAEFAAHWLSALTTVHIDGAVIGQRAAQLVIDRCRGLPVEPRIVDGGFNIIERESTAV